MDRSLSLFALLTTGALCAQSPNALHFDGVNDRVDCDSTASALDITGTQITLEAWIYPTSWKPTVWEGTIISKDHYFRGYMLRAGANGTLNFSFGDSIGWHQLDSPAASMQLNTWYHVAGTYNGTNSRLYINGALVATGSTTMVIASAENPLVLGDWGMGVGRNFPGIVDEVRIWNIARDAASIAASQNAFLCNNEPGLVAYYRCDQGIAGGNNTSITTLVDYTGTADGTLSGFTLNGTESNFVAGSGFGHDISATLCGGQTYTFNGEVLSDGGVYTAVYPTGGCDSTVNLTLTEVNVNTTTVLNGVVLTCINSGASWQWLDCGNGFAPIPGATFQTYTATANGSYAVEVTNDGCVDTSTCFTVTAIGLDEQTARMGARLLSDPVSDELVLLMDGAAGMLDLKVQDVQGRILRSIAVQSRQRLSIDVAGLPPGAYVLRVGAMGDRSGKRTLLKFIKE